MEITDPLLYTGNMHNCVDGLQHSGHDAQQGYFRGGGFQIPVCPVHRAHGVQHHRDPDVFLRLQVRCVGTALNL